MPADQDSLLLVGHGSRSAKGVAAYWEFADVLKREAPQLDIGCGFIELAGPDLDTAIERLVDGGARRVVAVPLVLLGAGHLKNDGPAALARARLRHPDVNFSYARDLGIHPAPLEVAAERIEASKARAVVLVSRGSTDPDANADLYKVARLLWDGCAHGDRAHGDRAHGDRVYGDRGVDMVEPAFVSLAPPSVPEALERCRRLGATAIAVVPYFLFTGVLVDRIHAQAEKWAQVHTAISVHTTPELGPDARLARLVLERYREAVHGDVRMNCDCCAYRVPLPGYEHRVGAPLNL